jgi:hypothetical protein
MLCSRASTLLGALLGAASSGCPDPIEPPVAVISVEARGSAREQNLDDGPSGAPADAGVCAAVHQLKGRVGEAPEIHASCSHDPAELTLSYHWMLMDLPAGSLAELHNDQAATPSLFPDLPGRYELSLIVSNGTLTSKPAHVIVDVER